MANVANFVKESCSTFGTGNLILTGAISGFTTFASALPAGSVYYTIVDGTNREAGIGTYDGAATIVRSNVIATLASGVYDDISLTPLVLTGAAVVGCGIEATLAAKIEHSNRAIIDAIDVAYTSALDTKLSGIEDAADVTDATNVAAAGAVMYADTNVSTAGWVVDEDTLVSADDTRVPTQQSVKNYVDSAVTSSVTASNVSCDTTGFAGILSGTDDDVQTALDTLDDHTHEGSTIDASGATDGHVLTADGAGNAAWEPIPGITGTAWGDITGTLSAQTDLQSALDGKEPADPTILKEADIGVTVQAYNANIPTVAASQAEMEAGTEMALRSMSPLRVKQAIDAIAAGNPVGAVVWVAMTTAPTGYLKSNGAAISRTAYADLFTAIGTTFGSGDGSTTFNLPDLRGEFIRGWDDGRGVDSGRSFGTAQADALKSHSHIYTNFSGHSSEGYAYGYGQNVSGTNTGSTGGTETRPRNITLLACIKY